jgi:hypothetical protein
MVPSASSRSSSGDAARFFTEGFCKWDLTFSDSDVRYWVNSVERNNTHQGGDSCASRLERTCSAGLASHVFVGGLASLRIRSDLRFFVTFICGFWSIRCCDSPGRFLGSPAGEASAARLVGAIA